ncbi:MAG: glycosyltransferase family 39 protein [Anaerolineae bacterium]|nr:glycosyltransferase family 39 protein [Anaerolineae bacterium]
MTTPAWLWALVPLLLAAVLVVPLLGTDIMDVDEAATMINACWRHLGPCTPAEAIERRQWLEHGWGVEVLFSQWGQVVGWSEFALRVLSWLFGLLTIAWIYRLGRDLFSPGIALAAATLLATSVIFLVYMNSVRSYMAALLCTVLVLWGYWRVALDKREVTAKGRIVLLGGATGLLYTHAFAFLLLPALALFHLLFVPRNRRWWQAVALSGLALLLALPQAHDLALRVEGDFDPLNDPHRASALRAPEVLSLLLRYLSSELLNPRHPAAAALFLVLPLVPIIGRLRNRRPVQLTGGAPFLAIATILQLLFTLALNAWGRVLDPTRVRYLSALWPPAMLLIALALLHPAWAMLRNPLGILLVLAVAVFGAYDFVQEGPLIQTSWSWRAVFPTADMNRIAQDLGDSRENLLVVQEWFFGAGRQRYIYTDALVDDTLLLAPDTTSADILQQARGNHELTFLLRSSMEETLHLQQHVDYLFQRHWLPHDSWQANYITFIRLVTPFSTMLIDSHALDFDDGIRISGTGILRETDTLRFISHIHSGDSSLLANHSLAVNVIDPDTGARVAQADSGIGEGIHVRKITDFDLGALPTGDYELHVAIYDWRTGMRLNARDEATGVVSDMHVLQRFHVE